MGHTELLVRYVCAAKFDDLPADVVKQAKLIILDSIGCALAGSRTKLGEVVIEHTRALGGKKESLIFGRKLRTNSLLAGYCNSILLDALDFEETALSHPSATIIPAAFALGEAAKTSGKNLILGVVLGFEVSLRIGYAILPSPEVTNPLATRSSFLSFGSCTAGGKILGLSSKELLNAFGYTGASTPLPLWATKWERPLHWIKNNFAEQTRAGILGVLMSSRGFLAPPNILDGDLGFWRMVGSDRCDFARLVEGLGTHYEIRTDTFKLYPACRSFHAVLDVIRDLTKENNIVLDQVDNITVKTFGDVVHWLTDRKPFAMTDGIFSLPYCIAMVLTDEEAGPSWYSEANLSSKRVASCMEKITVELDIEAEELYLKKGKATGTVEIRLRGGRQFVKKAPYAKGDPESPIGEDQIINKFENLAASVIPTRRIIAQIVDGIMNLETLQDITVLTSLVRNAVS